MKNILYLLSAVCLSFFLMMAVGCASTSEEPVETSAETETAEETVADETETVAEQTGQDDADAPLTDGALDALKAEAEALRAECLSVKLDAFFPEPWAEAETSYNAGVGAYGVSYAEAEAGFADAIEKYRALQERGAQSVEARMALLSEKKLAAEEAGARGYYPEQFAMAEKAEADAAAAYEAGDVETAAARLEDAIAYYSILCDGMEIRDLRQKIIENNFDTAYPDAYAAAEEQYRAAVAAFSSDSEEALNLSALALAAYQDVCNTGFQNLAEREKTRTDEMRELSDSIRASRTMPDAYKEASDIYDSAVTSGESGEWESAYTAYREASLYFAEIYQNVLYKKNAADEAMNAAKARQDASTALALEADRIAPLPEGYEENEAGPDAATESGAETAAGSGDNADDNDAPADSDAGGVSYEGEEVSVEDAEDSFAEEVGSERGHEYSVEDGASDTEEVTE